MRCIFLCDLLGDCIKNIPEILINCCKCEDDFCEICQDCCLDLCECCDCCSCCHDCCRCQCCFCKIWGGFWSIVFNFICFPLFLCCYLEKYFDRDDINELYQEEEVFCYCYKIQNSISWCCDLLFKNDVLEIIIIDIFLEFLTIGFGKIININLEENLHLNLLENNILIIGVYILYYIIIALFNRIRCFDNSNQIYTQYLYQLTGVTIWNAFIVTIISGFSAFGVGQFKEFTDNYLILLPYALTKFYYFILINSLVKKMDDDNLDLISNSTIISLFLMIFKFIASILTELLDIKELLLFRFIFGSIISLCIISLFVFSCCLIASIINELNGLKNN